MREIKFRAWDRNNRLWVDNNHLRILSDGSLIYEGNDELKSGIYVMQFTGLKDKNGKEVYEGDIVEKPNNTPYLDGSMGVVIYRPDIAGFVIHHPDNLPVEKHSREWLPLFNGNKNLSTQSVYEVIGNIYETPELLGEQPCKKDI